ncbi:MAG: hypothetical protein V1809_02540 [Planctomycetota bacterium]
MRMKKKKNNLRAMLLGLGFDHKDGHVRITKGENFRVLGGSHETHGFLQEKAVRFNEELDRRKKRLEDVKHDEFLEIADKVGMLKRQTRSP